MPRLSPGVELQETRLKPGEMPGMPLFHLASCNKKNFQKKPSKGESEGLCSLLRGLECRTGSNGDKPVALIGHEPPELYG